MFTVNWKFSLLHEIIFKIINFMKFWRKLKQTHASPSRERALKWWFYYQLDIQQHLALLVTISHLFSNRLSDHSYDDGVLCIRGSALFYVSKPLQNLPPRPLKFVHMVA